MIETTPSGTVLYGRYRIERVLGSGGFGHVYLAIDQTSNQQYAVKEYLVSGTSGQEQLRHEANVLSHLHHPNLPAFHDAFNERGRYYVVLNYIEGNDLTDLIRMARQRNEVIPITRILLWVLAVCDAVTFLHRQNPPVIHRDIKPDNIRITSDGTAVLVDLGNAKAAADGARTLFFIRHQGTPGYAPLEQYPGGSGTDVRSDVYALGGTLYFALTAHEPPSVSNRQAIQPGQPDLPSLQQQLANNPPEDASDANAARQYRAGGARPARPSTRHSRHIAQLATMPPELLNFLNASIQKAMAMKPKDRYPLVADFAADLRKVFDALTASQQTPSGRVVDPHSTQPDLPMLYEALQAAKSGYDTDPNSSSEPVTPTHQSAKLCPRCGTPLASQAIFCPRCGTTLTSPSSPATPGSQGSTLPPRNDKRDITNDQTLIISPPISGPAAPQAIAQAHIHPPSIEPTGRVTPSLAQPYAPSAAIAQTPTRQPAHRFVNGLKQTPSPDSSANNKNTRTTSGNLHSNIEPKVVIFMAVVLIILLVVMVVLLFMQSHRNVGLIDSSLLFYISHTVNL